MIINTPPKFNLSQWQQRCPRWKPQYKYASEAFNALWHGIEIARDEAGTPMLDADGNVDPCKLDTTPGLTVLYSPMGSGKSHLMKNLISFFPNNLIIAPYKTCKDDLSDTKQAHDKGTLVKANGKPMYNSFEYTFNYMNDLIKEFGKFKHADFATLTHKPNANTLAQMVEKWLDSKEVLPEKMRKLVIIDEIDFLYVQAQVNPIHFSDWTWNDSVPVLNAILSGMSKRYVMLGITASMMPYNAVKHKPVYLPAETTVRIKSLTTHLYSHINEDQIIRTAMQKIHDDNEHATALVYKRKYSYADGYAIGQFEKDNDLRAKTLTLFLPDNVGKKTVQQGLDESYFGKHGWNIRTGKIELAFNGCHYLVLKDGITSLDKACEVVQPDGTIKNTDPYTAGYKYVFINTSSSRQVSLERMDTCTEPLPFRVICFGSNYDATMFQASARARHNPVDLEIHLHNKRKQDYLDYYEGNGLIKFQECDPFTNAYHLYAENIQVEWAGSMGTRIGNAVTATTAQRKELLARFLTQCTKGTKQDRLNVYRRWLSWFYPDSKPYSINVFYKAASATTIGATA